MNAADTVPITRQLASWAAGLTADRIPADVRDKTSRLLLDGLGCGLFGSTTSWGRLVSDLVVDNAGKQQATVWGVGARVPATEAPLANGTFMHSFEFDDLHASAVLHGAAQVLPSALAVTELRIASGADGSSTDAMPRTLPTADQLICAASAGMEIGARIGISTGSEQLRRGFHPSPNTGLFSAAVTAAKLLELNEQETAHALGIAASSGGFLMAAQYGAMVKRMHPGRSAQAGVTAALLAARGFTGIDGAIEQPYGGFARAYAGLEPDGVSGISSELGRTWETRGFSIKAYPCCGSNHTAIDAYSAILREHPGLRAEDIESIDVACSTLTYEHVGWPYRPDSVTSAQMNLSYTLAALAVDRQLFVDQFAADRLDDPRILAIASRITLRPDSAIDRLGRSERHRVRLTVRTRDQATYHAEVAHARGSAQHPLTDEEAGEKYRKLAAASLLDEDVAALEDAVLALAHGGETTDPASRILAAIRRPVHEVGESRECVNATRKGTP